MQNYHETDPEFAERFDHFAFDEVVNEPGQQLEPVTRHMAILATLLGCQGKEEFAEELPRALDAGLTPVMVKEIVYQAVDYLGIGRVRPFLDLTNEELTRRGVALPLEPQATTTMDDPARKRRAGAGRHLRPPDARSLEGRAHQPLAGGQLLWRLLYPHRPEPGPAGDDYLLLSGCAGRLRTPADQPRQGQHEPRQRQGLPDPGRLPVSCPTSATRAA